MIRIKNELLEDNKREVVDIGIMLLQGQFNPNLGSKVMEVLLELLWESYYCVVTANSSLILTKVRYELEEIIKEQL